MQDYFFEIFERNHPTSYYLASHHKPAKALQIIRSLRVLFPGHILDDEYLCTDDSNHAISRILVTFFGFSYLPYNKVRDKTETIFKIELGDSYE